MATCYRITVKLSGPLATDLISGTLWGHLAWAVRYTQGEPALKHWLEEQEADPWLISSRMPEGMLPRPMLAPYRAESIGDIGEMTRYKSARKVAFISEKLFLSLRSNMNAAGLLTGIRLDQGKAADLLPWRASHNRINRQTGRTPETGGLFFEDARIASIRENLQFFIQTSKPCKEELLDLLNFISISGFGANASTGYGALNFDIQEEKTLFSFSGNAAVSLSHGILTPNMESARYKQHVHFGKLGGHYAAGGFSPFKYPILMMRPGATFQPKNAGPYGRLLDRVHHDRNLDHIRHYALHLPLYYNEAQP